MKTLVFILLIVSLVTLFLTTTASIICLVPNNKAYCYIFEHKDWKLWESVCKALPHAIFVEHNTFEDTPALNSYLFHIYTDETRPPVEIVYWENRDEISVHYAGECLLSDFDKHHVKKAKQILKSLFPDKLQ